MDHLAAPPGEIYWRYSVPPRPSAKMLLLTIGGVAVVGTWQGQLGEYFQAWSPMPKKRKES